MAGGGEYNIWQDKAYGTKYSNNRVTNIQYFHHEQGKESA